MLVGVESLEEAGTQQAGQLQDPELPKVLNLEKKRSEHFKWTHLEEVQHCTDLRLQVTFPAQTDQGKDGTRVGMNVSTLKKKKKKKKKSKKAGKREAGEERKMATNFKEAACCPSSVVQGGNTAKKGLCGGSVRSNWDPREGQQQFRSNPNGVGDRTTTLRWLLIGTDLLVLLTTVVNTQNI